MSHLPSLNFSIASTFFLSNYICCCLKTRSTNPNIHSICSSISVSHNLQNLSKISLFKMGGSSAPSWQRKLHLRKAILLNSIRTENFTYLHIQAALFHDRDTTEPDSHALAEATARQIKNLNITFAEENETAFAGYKAETEALEVEMRAASEWTRRMRAGKEKAKTSLCEAVHNIYNLAEDLIHNLPHHKQDAAYDLFAVGQNFVSQVFDWCVTEMTRVIDSIVDFMKGIWTAMDAAWITIHEGVNTVIDWIKGIFGGGPSEAPHNHDHEQRQRSPQRLQLVQEHAPPPPTPAPAPAQSSLDQLVDVRLELVWLSSPMLSETSVNMAMLYLHGQFDRALGRHVEMGHAYQHGLAWHAMVVVGNVDVLSISTVISTIKEVVKEEQTRREPLPGHPHVPTPDPITAQNPSAVSKGADASRDSERLHLAPVTTTVVVSESPKKKSEVLHLATLTPLRSGGRHLSGPMSAPLTPLSPSRVYTVVE